MNLRSEEEGREKRALMKKKKCCFSLKRQHEFEELKIQVEKDKANKDKVNRDRLETERAGIFSIK